MVLELLVADEEGCDDDRGRRAARRDRDEHDEHRGDGRSRERDQVEKRDEQAERDDVGHADDPQDDARRDAGNQADQEVAGDVAADGAIDVVTDAAPARLLLLRQHAVDAVHPPRPLEQHEEGHEDDRQGRRHRGEDALRDRDRGARTDRELADTAALHGMLDALDDVVARLEEAKTPATLREVVDVIRNLVREVVHLVDERRDEEREQAAHHRERHDERDSGGEAATRDAVSLQPLDCRIERQCEEERDQEPAQHVTRHPEHIEDDSDRDHDPQHREDRARTEMDDPVDGHAGKFLVRSRLPSPRG